MAIKWNGSFVMCYLARERIIFIQRPEQMEKKQQKIVWKKLDFNVSLSSLVRSLLL